METWVWVLGQSHQYALKAEREKNRNEKEEDTEITIYVTVVSDLVRGFSYLHKAPSKLLYLTKELKLSCWN